MNLVERLRSFLPNVAFGAALEAADRIEQLTAQRDVAMNELTADITHDEWYEMCNKYDEAVQKAAEQSITIAELTAQRDEAMNRLAWIERKLFVSSWNGVVGNGNATTWSIAGDWRHTVAALKKDDFGESIDAAIANCKEQK